jgi:hypothetical protein
MAKCRFFTIAPLPEGIVLSSQKSLMKKYIFCGLSAWFILISLFFVPKAFSQMVQNETVIEADSVAAMDAGKSTTVKGITAGRAKSLVPGVLGLISLVVGWRAKARSSRKGARVALVSGITAIILSIIHLATSAGAVFGSGSGKAGAIVALLLASAGVILSGLALRSRNGN